MDCAIPDAGAFLDSICNVDGGGADAGFSCETQGVTRSFVQYNQYLSFLPGFINGQPTGVFPTPVCGGLCPLGPGQTATSFCYGSETQKRDAGPYPSEISLCCAYVSSSMEDDAGSGSGSGSGTSAGSGGTGG
jgi:hypothetical protein